MGERQHGACRRMPALPPQGGVGGSSYLLSELPYESTLNLIVVVRALLIACFGELASQTVVPFNHQICSQMITAIRVSLAGVSEMQNRTEPFLVSLTISCLDISDN